MRILLAGATLFVLLIVASAVIPSASPRRQSAADQAARAEIERFIAARAKQCRAIHKKAKRIHTADELNATAEASWNASRNNVFEPETRYWHAGMKRPTPKKLATKSADLERAFLSVGVR